MSQGLQLAKMTTFTTMEPFERPAIVMDCGTGFTKMGFAGNLEPTFVEPTAVSFKSSKPHFQAGSASAADADVLIGHEAISSSTSDAHYPVRHGLVENWDHMERFWQQAVHRYLRVDSEDHNFILTEPPLNPPENREMAAEIMFETFNVPGLCIGIQAVLALYSAFTAAEKGPQSARGKMTGTVIDSGAGCTHVIPVSDGYVIGSAIHSIPIAGRNITRLVQQLMRERGEPVPGDLSMEVAQQIKEEHCYTCGDIVKEFGKYDADPVKHTRSHSFFDSRQRSQQTCSVQHERFLAPELFFRPDFISNDYTTPLPQMVDRAIQSCPIDTRRGLYSNIVLSGGSTMFKDFGRRVQRDIQRTVGARQAPGGKAVEVHVASHAMQRYAVWFGGSVLGMMPEFSSLCKTRAEYEECGPSICRASAAFRDELP